MNQWGKFPSTQADYHREYQRKKMATDPNERERRRRRDRTKRAKRPANQLAFLAYKESLGCSRCGYNRFGGSLDYHHVDPRSKKHKIYAEVWWAQGRAWQEESNKCVLLCKNCHYEEHYRMRRHEK